MLIFELYLFECYTKGRDSFSDDGLKYRYSGRDWRRQQCQGSAKEQHQGIQHHGSGD